LENKGTLTDVEALARFCGDFALASPKTREPGYSFLDCRASFLKPHQTLKR
jgi:hypothetical protein